MRGARVVAEGAADGEGLVDEREAQGQNRDGGLERAIAGGLAEGRELQAHRGGREARAGGGLVGEGGGGREQGGAERERGKQERGAEEARGHLGDKA